MELVLSVINAVAPHRGHRGEPSYTPPTPYPHPEIAAILHGADPFQNNTKLIITATARNVDGKPGELTKERIEAEGYQHTIKYFVSIDGGRRQDITTFKDDEPDSGTQANVLQNGFNERIALSQGGAWVLECELTEKSTGQVVKSNQLTFRVK